jgi:choline dehydrogenase-like flavoprotein
MELRCNGAAPELVLGVARKSSATRGTTMEFDEIIVGSGSSGAVLAARLSEDRGRQVLLIEAGPDYPDLERTPKSLLNGRQQPSDHDWGFTAEMVAGRSTTYPRGKVIGGTSSVNGCVAPFGPFNLRHDSVRISTAIAYLLPARGRANLSIRSDCLVDRVLFDGNRAIGVEMEHATQLISDHTATGHGNHYEGTDRECESVRQCAQSS